jgi:gamma-tubulin complex component 2
LKVLEAFTLDYKVKWPLTLILSFKSITKYQLIFRHLLFCKYVERSLENLWLTQQSTKELKVLGIQQHAFALRHRMLHFCKNYIYYMTIEVLEPNFLKLKERLLNGGDVQTIDDVMKAHDGFLDQCLKECLLTDHNLFRILTRLNQNNNFFARIIQRFFNQMSTFEVHERAVAENEYYDQHTKYMGDDGGEEQKHGEGGVN